MSEVKHAFRLMIIDIDEDKVVVDEFCDAVIAGAAKNPEKGNQYDGGNVIVACRCGLGASVAAMASATEAVRKQKAKVVASLLEEDGIGNAQDLMKAVLEGEDLTDEG